MSIQDVVIFLVFALAVAYMAYRAYTSFFNKKAGCGKGCGCATDVKSAATKYR